jgi:hypothetical protein
MSSPGAIACIGGGGFLVGEPAREGPAVDLSSR